MNLSCEAIATAALGPHLKREGAELVWRCPQSERHENGDQHPSFFVNPKKNVWACFPCNAKGKGWALAAFIAGVAADDKAAVANWLRERGLLNGNSRPGPIEQKRVAEYYFTDRLRKVRLEPGFNGKPKTFIWEHLKNGKWKSCDGGLSKPFYTNSVFDNRDQIDTVLAVEGEGKVDIAGTLGFPAFSYKDGLTLSQCARLADLDVVIWPDADPSGTMQAEAAAKILLESNQLRAIRRIEPPLDLKSGGDIIDAIKTLGYGKIEIDGLVADARPFTADPPKPETDVQELSKTVVEPAALPLADMPDTVLCGTLGEICKRRMARFPVAYSWPALVAAAGILSHQGSTLRSNLFVALVGPPHSGKSTAIDHATGILGLAPPLLQNTMAGSAEGLLGNIGDAGGTPRLYSPDELGHLFSKAQIDRSSFTYVLNRLFYQTCFDLVIAKGKTVSFNCSLGVLGGIVDEKFDQCFGSATVAGTYDRFIFGQFPSPFDFNYRPLEGPTAFLPASVSVAVAPGVWELRDEWIKTIPGMTGRVAENALRIASICASIDGRTLLKPDDLQPALAFAQYQIRVRQLLYANPGENIDAVCAFSIIAAMDRLAPDGEPVAKRTIYRNIHGYRFGPSVFKHAGDSLIFNGEIERSFEGPKNKEIWRKS